LPADLDFGKKVVAWVFLGCMFYGLNFTWLFFGNRRERTGPIPDKVMNLVLLLFFYAFAMKTILTVSASSAHEVVLFSALLNYVAANEGFLQLIFFNIGWIGLAVYSLYISIFSDINPNSLLGNLHIDTKPWIVRFVSITLLLFSFSLLVFDLVLEWLGIAIESLLIMLAIGAYLFLIVKKHKHFSADNLIYRIGNFAENFEEHFLKFFHDKAHVFLGITGLLVLHLLTDISTFLIPYIFGLSNSFYFNILGHEPLLAQYLADISLANPIVVSLAYVFNVVGVFMLLILPAYMWYEVYSNNVHMLPKWLTSLTLSSILVILVSPLFKFTSLNHPQLVGVDIVGLSVVTPQLTASVIGAVVLFVGLLALAHLPLLRKVEYHAIMTLAVGFMLYYLFFFYTSTMTYMRLELLGAFQAGAYVIFGVFSLLFLMTVAFLVFGSIKFIIQIVRHHIL